MKVKLREWKLSGCSLFYRDHRQVLAIEDHVSTVP